jgi:hypothetical protein
MREEFMDENTAEEIITYKKRWKDTANSWVNLQLAGDRILSKGKRKSKKNLDRGFLRPMRAK